MKSNIGKAITLLNEVKTPLPSHQQKITEAITLLKREDEQRQPLVPGQNPLADSCKELIAVLCNGNHAAIQRKEKYDKTKIN